MKKLLVAAIFGLCVSSVALAQTILLDDFTGGGSTGIISGTSWASPNAVVFNGTSISVGSPALDDNGWGYLGSTIDARGMLYLNVTARRDLPYNTAPFLVIEFDDDALDDARIFHIDTNLFTTGATTTVQVPIGSWGNTNPSDITGWSIGGGTSGLDHFGMTLDNLSLTTTAIPEPSTVAMLTAISALGFAARRRRRATAV